jgi:hypothetical protein
LKIFGKNLVGVILLARGRTAGLLEALEDSFMDQLVNFPTQVKGNTLDLI